ncbi:MAG: hypothetical protein A2622_13130 [Bdellovibrionales bacterium RIFCSPHIGHO2_01_FULL_40_29]|nr:MAG: hypothetical protein A2622_13130 [Bdellovibrionales bacterium RIFCSPHIGHO2_01_FULL_40_29]OFZ33367.1 MAG: hypothetical protein A3D17_13755 [Bdellovibrionales bacterium RIFCSPHIGHO2_02_FULL_40_15]
MKKQFYIILATLLISVLSVAQSGKRKPSSIDIKSSHEIIFYAKSELGFSDMGKIVEYQGSLVQINEPNSNLNEADLYKFPKESRTLITTKICSEYVEKIFGKAEDRSLKVDKTVQLFQTPVGKACDFQMTDSYHHAKLPYRYAVIGFVHGRLIALVWSFDQKITTENVEQLKTFWKSLK